MAVANKTVLLGFVDEWIENEKADYYINKIGGLPDWCSEGCSVPKCGNCGLDMVQVVQVYAPLSNSSYHRTLHIFGCLQPNCWNKDESWACVRSQIVDNSRTEEEDKTLAPIPNQAATDWLGDADDWGDDNSNDDNGNPAIMSNLSTPSPVGAVGGVPRFVDSPKHTSDITMENLSIRDVEKNDPNANIGAFAQSEVTAQVEMDAEDSSTIALDSPDVNDTNLPELFTVPKGTRKGRLRSAYLWVQEERHGNNQELDHATNLLLEYKAKEALDQITQPAKKTGNNGSDLYEKSVPKHGDTYLHKMICVLQDNPGQILRYDRGSTNPPLLLRPLAGNVPHPCRHCGGESVFELQLLPSLVSQLRMDKVDDIAAPLEFGTVLLFTCSKSCWPSDGTGRFETILVQPENM